MACTPLYGSDRTVMGYVCGPRGQRTRVKCQFCGTVGAGQLCDGILGGVQGELLADSPDVKVKTCDAPVCRSCAVSIPALDRDYCPRCMKAEPLECAVGPSPEHPCRGPTVDKDRACLAHSLLFTRWLQAHGGAEVYADKALSRDEKRQRFRFWLAAFPSSSARGVFLVAGWRVS
jgi:hypothetical protein